MEEKEKSIVRETSPSKKNRILFAGTLLLVMAVDYYVSQNVQQLAIILFILGLQYVFLKVIASLLDAEEYMELLPDFLKNQSKDS